MVWCDNCLLLFPLRAGAFVLAAIIAVYSLAGGIFLFLYGNLFWFTYPEPQIYGGISCGIFAICIISFIALSTRSYMWTRVIFYLSPFILFVIAVRAGMMMFRLDYYQANVVWECNHGGQVYNATLAANASYLYDGVSNGSYKLPSSFCSTGFHTLYLAFVFGLVIDGIFQLYFFFCMWRFKALLESYFAFKFQGNNIYTA